MGRKKKVVNVDERKFENLSRNQKLELINDFNQLFHYELSKIPYSELVVTETGKAEVIAEMYFKERGYSVYRSKIQGGYRCIGVEFYWKQFKDNISDFDRIIIDTLSSIMTVEELNDLAQIVKQKSGTPDLLLIKDNKISFVEVKFNHETVKQSTVEFYLKYGHKWPISIFRVIKK